MATTEEMNRVIARYLGYKFSRAEKCFYKVDEDGMETYCTYMKWNNLEYHKDWNRVVKVWDKLRGELEAIKSVDVQVRKNNIAINLYNANITTAHRLIYEAITWLNQNK